MCNPTPEKRQLLNNINSYSIGDLHNFIQLHNFELSCFIQYGLTSDKLNTLDLNLVKERVSFEHLSKEKLLEGGMSQHRVDEIFGSVIPAISCPKCNKEFNNVDSYEAFKNICNECQTTIKQTEQTESSGQTTVTSKLLQRIIERKANVQDIQDALLNEELSPEILKNQAFLSDEMIQRFYSYSSQQMSPVDIDKLPPLRPDRTDFYFLGMPSAGKSCLVASLLSHWMRKGMATPEVTNPRSVQYFNLLGGQFSRGILPMNNPNAFVDYIELTLNFSEEYKDLFGRPRSRDYNIPINILDMAGEKFRKVANPDSNDGSVAAVGDAFDKHKKYLFNKNPKALFFILDYSIDNGGSSAWDQSANLVVVLKILEKMGIIDETDSIYLVVTKSDMFNVPLSGYRQAAIDYVDEYYKGFKNELDRMARRYGFSQEILPYSIGECTFGQLMVDFDPRSNEHLRVFPEDLSQRVLNLTGRYRSGIGGIFTN
jgi:hypothetical protein